MTKITANSDMLAKPKAKPRGKPFQKGVSGNPAGAPKRGESWAEIIQRIGSMTPKEAAEHARAIAGKLAIMGDAITLKEAVVIRVYAALLFEPQPGLLNTFMERAEGKVKEKIDINHSGEVSRKEFSYEQLISGIAPRPEIHHISQGENENNLHGEEMGQNDNGGTSGTSGSG